jgi:signal transduction histidine kinase
MNFRAVENKARLAMALFVVALVLTIGLSLALYSQARRDLADQRLRQVKTDSELMASRLSQLTSAPSDALLDEILKNHDIKAHASWYSADRRLLGRASTLERQPEEHLLRPMSATDPRLTQAGKRAQVEFLGDFDVAQVAGPNGTVLVLATPAESQSSPVIFYVFSYQVVALVFGLGLVFLLARWLLRPYGRMVEAARGSPVLASTARSESEFVVDTFKALVEQLHTKERELAHLHELERRRAERSERFSERLISNIPSGLVTIDSRGTVTSANSQGIKIFSASGSVPDFAIASDGELHSLEVDCATFFAGAPQMVEMISKCLSSGGAFRREEVDVVYPDGRVCHLGLSISPITDASHKIEGALCLMTDLTEVIELRERMKLQESLANLGEMAAGLAHEFKNSLATIHGYVQLLEAQNNSLQTSANPATLDATLNEVRLLARLVTDFLNFARPQKLSLSTVELRVMIDECVDEVRSQLSEAGIEIRVHGQFTNIAGDDSMLRRAFVNLLRNAAEAIESHSPEKRIELEGSVDQGRKRYAHIRICDTGTGISASDLHNIFIPFFTTKDRGYGIGLAIVQKILVAHGGDVSVERSDKNGTVFHCRLPLLQDSGHMERR